MRFLWLGLAALAFISPANAQVDPGNMEAVKALRGGGHVIVFRHGATHADQADTDPLNPANIEKQRQLNDQGRALARSIGEAMRKLNIPVGQVVTSQFNRAVETGTPSLRIASPIVRASARPWSLSWRCCATLAMLSGSVSA